MSRSVEILTGDFETLESVRQLLRSMYDIERLAVKLSTRRVAPRVAPRDLASLKHSLQVLPRLRKILAPLDNDLLRSIASGLGDFSELAAAIERAVIENPPMSLRDGGFIRKGYSSEVDELRDIASNSRDYLARFETQERSATGINTLKVGYNKIYGYYVEVTRANIPLVPERYTRKQTLVNPERLAHARAGALRTPLLLMQSGADRLVDPEAPARWAAAAPPGLVEQLTWEGFYHEMFNEPGREQVRARTHAWLREHLPSGAPTHQPSRATPRPQARMAQPARA